MADRYTIIRGYDRPLEEMPSNKYAKMAWIEEHYKVAVRRGHWSDTAARRLAGRMGIVSDLEIKRR